MNAEVAIVGAGPAGGEAALTLAAAGVDVVLVDENASAGGQVWRQRFDGWDDGGPGAELRRRIAASDVRTLFDARVWHLERADDGFAVDVLQHGEAMRLSCTVLILATGARERMVPCSGWTTPGVIGLAGATALLKGQGVAPGTAVLVTGGGPLLYALAADLLDRGVRLPAVVDLAQRQDWLRAMPGLLARPRLAATGARWMTRIARAGVPMLFGHAVRAIEGDARVTAATVGPVDRNGAPRAGGERRFEADAVCLGHGLVPSTEAAALLGAAVRFDPRDRSWGLERDAEGATAVPGLFVAGDGGAIEGAAAAVLGGRLAAAAALRRLRPMGADHPTPPDRAHAAAARFGRTTARLATPRDGAYASLQSTTVACRCESVTVAALDRAIAAGAHTIGSLKGATRAGMGPCGGRTCGDVIAARLACKLGCAVGAIEPGVARSPLRPVPLGALAAGFDYAELPPLTPSPL